MPEKPQNSMTINEIIESGEADVLMEQAQAIIEKIEKADRTPDAISYKLGVPVKLYGPAQEGGLCSFQLSVGDWTCDGTAQGADLEAARESLLEQARALLEKVAAGGESNKPEGVAP